MDAEVSIWPVHYLSSFQKLHRTILCIPLKILILKLEIKLDEFTSKSFYFILFSFSEFPFFLKLLFELILLDTSEQ